MIVGNKADVMIFDDINYEDKPSSAAINRLYLEMEAMRHRQKFMNRVPSDFLTIEQTDLNGAWYKRYQHEFNFVPKILSIYIRGIIRGLL